MKTSTFIKGSILMSSFMVYLGTVNAQMTFTNANSALHSQNGTAGSNSGVHSGNTVLITDIDGNGLDDIAKLDENRYLDIEYQQPGGTFIHANNVFDIGAGGVSIWGASMSDVDHNGYKDFLYAGWGGGGARLIKLDGTGTGNLGITSLPGGGGIASQNCNFMDVNNDGWADIFVCNDVNESLMWVNDGTGNFPAEQGNGPYIDFDVTPGTSAPNDESGNYGSVWSDFDGDGDVDLYIIHCRQGRPAGDIRRTNVLFENNGSNVYTSTAASHGLASNDQDWTGSFGDVDNDGDLDLLLTGHEAGNTNRLLLNDGSGNFSPSGTQPTISFGSTPQQSFMEDFDNDGWIDIIISGTTLQRLHRNNGDGTFTEVASPGWITSDNWISFACGDLNHDGKIDFYSSYGSIYNNPSGSVDDVYYQNTTSNSNHFITFNLVGTTSTPGALNAKVYIYGPWGTQVREVRASESYGTLNSSALHFGLGSATTVDSAIVRWQSGAVTSYTCGLAADQFITVTEGTPACTLACTGVTATPGGPTTFCPGDSVQLTAPSGTGYSYLWSNGDTTQSTYASSTGAYSVVVSTGSGCSASSPSVDILVNPDETPTVTVGGPTTFCPGGSVMLTSSSATGNTWSTSETTQSITVASTGSYTVDYAGLCQAWTSDTVHVNVLSAPAPSTTDDFIPAPGSGTVTATGNEISWYDASTGGSLLDTGASYTTPVISATTTYYAEDVYEYGGGTGNLGQVYHDGTDYNGSTYNGYVIFDVASNATLNQVKVYTDTPGDRTIELRDNIGTVLQSLTVNIPVDTSWVTLNFPLTPGTDYELGTNTADNNTVLGFNSPRLMRSNAGVAYPYTYSGAVTITSGSAGAGNYYYFYDWEVSVDPDNVCITERSPATVYLTAGIEDELEGVVNIYPNPATDYVNVEITTPEVGEATLEVFDMLGKKAVTLNLGVINGSTTQVVNTSTFAAGVYTVRINVNDKVYTSNIVVK